MNRYDYFCTTGPTLFQKTPLAGLSVVFLTSESQCHILAIVYEDDCFVHMGDTLMPFWPSPMFKAGACARVRERVCVCVHMSVCASEQYFSKTSCLSIPRALRRGANTQAPSCTC